MLSIWIWYWTGIWRSQSHHVVNVIVIRPKDDDSKYIQHCTKSTTQKSPLDPTANKQLLGNSHNCCRYDFSQHTGQYWHDYIGSKFDADKVQVPRLHHNRIHLRVMLLQQHLQATYISSLAEMLSKVELQVNKVQVPWQLPNFASMICFLCDMVVSSLKCQAGVRRSMQQRSKFHKLSGNRSSISLTYRQIWRRIKHLVSSQGTSKASEDSQTGGEMCECVSGGQGIERQGGSAFHAGGNGQMLRFKNVSCDVIYDTCITWLSAMWWSYRVQIMQNFNPKPMLTACDWILISSGDRCVRVWPSTQMLMTAASHLNIDLYSLICFIHRVCYLTGKISGLCA